MGLILDHLPFRSSVALHADENNILQAAADVLKFYKVKVSRTQLIAELKSHPHYPSLLCLGDVLKQYNIDSLSLQVAPDDLVKIEEPFVSFLSLKEELLFVKPDRQGNVTYQPRGKPVVHESLNEFAKKYVGVLLLPEPMIDEAGQQIHTRQGERGKT
ncbi:MAG: cysteine peptidase family C39 domain-containing protein, partial [Chitinophagaceae bacterium]